MASLLKTVSSQVLAGRDINSEGFCYIPTTSERIGYMKNVGFRNIEVTYQGVSHVVVGESWKGQFGNLVDERPLLDALKEIARRTVASNPIFAKETNAHMENNDWIVDFPILVIKADK